MLFKCSVYYLTADPKTTGHGGGNQAISILNIPFHNFWQFLKSGGIKMPSKTTRRRPKGEGSIITLPSGKVRVRVELDPVDGKRQWLSATADTKKILANMR
jgi:hypothetical protein